MLFQVHFSTATSTVTFQCGFEDKNAATDSMCLSKSTFMPVFVHDRWSQLIWKSSNPREVTLEPYEGNHFAYMAMGVDQSEGHSAQ